VWYDDTVQRLNVDGRGELLGEFRPSDKILIIQQSGKLK
jgi:topoisomerase-4 subunit A